MLRGYLSFAGLEQVILLLLYHEAEHKQNQVQGQSSVVDIKGIDTEQMFELNFNVENGLYNCPVNTEALSKLAKCIRERLERSQKHNL